METMQLITTTDETTGGTMDLLAMTDVDIEAFFASEGLTVEVVDTCADASCPDCFGSEPARAA